ncbi:metallophosphoesterase [Salegentibacter flavus]|uniref:Calcineurin-like phosphoesterase n=1 Tax=Salegentibacter flavus TaxID=287099 RepID=A0A1I5A7T1_9FLAO|nr:metallophosphoesterase [Salegentibacter flavus]SFN58552.1 Calcineurin-like phosphoesterase [Salegentibacter flavus]
MKKYIFLPFLALLVIITSCATVKTKIHEDEPKENFGYPADKEIEKSFYLIGDGGYSPEGGSSEGLIAFKNFLDSVKKPENYTFFLGDNIYPDGMPPEGDPEREKAEYMLDAQLDAIEEYDGNVLVIPGNHDWYNKGIPGLDRQEEYLKEKFENNLIWSPDTGCGLDIIEVSDDIQLIVIDSQWYLEDWDRHPKINNDCGQIKTREAMLLEVETELKKSQNKTVLITLHHPVLSNGIHGGQYNFNRHIYPTQKKLPIPILGSLAMLIRTTGGVSIQDLQNERYKSLARRLETIAHRRERVIFVAGHEHSLQYIDNGNIKQIVSGSGSKGTFASLSNDGRFAYGGQGFAVLDVFKDGSSWVSFYGNEKNKAKLLFQKEIFSAPQEYDLSQFSTEFPETITTSVYSKEETEKNDFHRTVWGKRYRELYGKEIEVKVADLDTLYGGLEPLIKSGGHQTVSVRLKDTLNREYNMRRIRKESVQYLQKVAFKTTPIQDDLENTVAERLMTDFYTAAHPYAFLAVPGLASAVDVHHTNPELFYMPKQPILGKYNEEHGDDIYMIVERPEENWLGKESFGSPNHDIVSTADMFDRLRRDEKYILDEPRYVRSRIFDMLIGDWDRHQDQWRWAEIEDQEGNRTFEAIPRDRDQVFSNFDGAFFGTLRALAGFANQFAVYDEDIKDVEWFNIAAVGLDRSLLQNVGRDTWLKEAKFIQENMTDEVIEEAFEKLPPESREETLEDLIAKLKGRRDNIVSISMRYYDHLASLAIVTGTDKDDFIDVIRMPEGKTRVTVTRNKGGERAEILSDKIYSREETKDIWIYGLDDEDKIRVEGKGDEKIYLRIIGGLGNDIYTIKNGSKLKLYDHKSLPNTITEAGDARFRFRDHYDINTYDKDKKNFKGGAFLPGLGYNPDDGFKIGIESVYTVNDFKRNPFTSKHTYGGGYYFATNGFDLYYEGEFANIIGRYNLQVGASYNSPNFASNLFGYGNETENFDDELGMDYNRVKISRYAAKAGFVRKTPFGSYFSYMANFEINKVEDTEGRFIHEDFNTTDEDFFKRKYFAGLDALYRYESYDNSLNPTRGMKFELNLGGKLNTSDTDQHYGYFKPYWSFFNALSRNRKLVLKSKVMAHLNMGDGYEFYQAARLGGESGLRGYRLHRFIGKSAFATGGDLRYSFDEFKTGFLPLQLGVFGGYDLGRVWNDFEESNKWHDSYGGGFWVTSARAVNGTFSFFKGSEGWRFAFGLGFEF